MIRPRTVRFERTNTGTPAGRICAITGFDDRVPRFEHAVSVLLESGIRWVQYRDKTGTRKEIFFRALLLRELTGRYGACLIVNDYVDIALAVDADGVHLGQDDLPLEEARRIMGDRIIGISTHNLREAAEAEKAGADYIGFGPVFDTATKDAGLPVGTDALREIKRAVGIPVIAIGGIRAENLGSVLDTGCDGVAVSSGLMKGDIKDNVRKFLKEASG